VSVVGFLVIIAVCLAASAFFSGSETALIRLRAHELDKEVERADGPTGVAVRELTASTSRLLVTILLGNNVANILGAGVASALAIQFLGPRVGIPLATLIMTSLVLIFREIFPKAVAARHPRGGRRRRWRVRSGGGAVGVCVLV
jgi:Mg2+/Co2+ transporter CorB